MGDTSDFATATPQVRPRHERLLDGLLEGCQLLSPDLRYLYLNEAALKHARRPAEELLGRTMTEAYPGIEQTELYRTLRGCLEQRTTARLENEFRYPDGRVSWFEIAIHPDPEGLVILSYETTAAREASARLAEAQRIAKMGSFEVERDGSIAWSPELFTVLDRDPSHGPAKFDALGASANATEWSELQAAVERCRATGVPFVQELRLPTREGMRWLRARAEAIPSADGPPLGARGTVQDVTASKIEELESETARAELAAIVDASPVAIVAIDRSDRVVLWNATAARMFGYTQEEAVGRAVPIIPAERRAEFATAIGRARAGERPILTHTQRQAKDGRLLSVMLAMSPIRGAGGAIAGTVAVIVDLAPEARLRAELQAAERRFAAAFATSPVAKVLVRKADGIVVDANPAFLGLVHKSADQLRGARFEGLGTTNEPSALATWAKLLTGPKADADDGVTHEIDGVERHFRVNADHFEALDGPHVMLRLQDVTADRERDRALAESEERFRQLAETIGDVFWLTDVDKHRIIYVSPGYDAIWGRPGALLFEDARGWLEAIHPDDRERVLQAALAKQALGTYDEEYRIVRPDGTIRWVRDRAYPVKNAEGHVYRVAGAATDVTDRKALEEQLRQSQKLESVGVLAGGVAHDFNNILTVIASGCYALRDHLRDADSREVLDEMAHATERATGLTRQLLAFSRREVVAPRVLDVQALVGETEKLLRRLVGEDIRLTIARAPEPLAVFADPGHLTQVLMNLAVNARQAMPRGGSLVISTAVVGITEGDPLLRGRLMPGRYAVISVQDSGVGMSPAVRERIFEPFFTTRPVGEGTGLGLSVVHGIVAQSGGTIEVESTEGVGTTFHIYLPFREGPLSVRPSQRHETLARGTETILVVEDDPSIRRIVQRTLEEAGYSVLTAKDGIAALAVSSRHDGTIDLLLTDVVMPRMDGRALATELQRLRPKLRVLFTSGYTTDDVVRWGVREEETEFLAKPFAATSLRAKIRSVLDRSRPD